MSGGAVPDDFEVRRVEGVEEELGVLAVVGQVGVALGNPAVFADHVLAILDWQAEGGGQGLGGPAWGLCAPCPPPPGCRCTRPDDDLRVVAEEVVAHRPNVGDQVVGGAGRHHQARALELVGDIVDVRRPAHERVEAWVLHEDLRRRRRVGRPFEINVARVNARINEQRHDEVMAGRILGQHHLLALAVLDPQIVDAADVAAGDHAVAARREVNLLAHHGHGAGVLDQFRRKQGDHVQRAPEDVALAAGEQVARLDRVIHDGQVDIEPVFLGKDALVVRRPCRRWPR